MDTLWQTQQYTKPLFEDLIWSKPQQKTQAGKLLIIGGNSNAISAPSEAFAIAIEQGIGEVKAALPDKTKKLLGPKIPHDIQLVSSTPSGSFSKNSLLELENYCMWAEATLFAGDIGKNSETAIVLEALATKMAGPQIFTRDALEYFTNTPLILFDRPETLLVMSLPQLQKYAQHSKYTAAITFKMGLNQLAKAVSELSSIHKAYLVVQNDTNILTGVSGKVVVTKMVNVPDSWRLKTAASASVWWLQNPQKPLEAIATSITQVSY